MAKTYTPKEIANELGISPKRLRAHMRKDADAATKEGADPRIARVGQGNRYALSASDAAAIKRSWNAAHATKDASHTEGGDA